MKVVTAVDNDNTKNIRTIMGDMDVIRMKMILGWRRSLIKKIRLNWQMIMTIRKAANQIWVIWKELYIANMIWTVDSTFIRNTEQEFTSAVEARIQMSLRRLMRTTKLWTNGSGHYHSVAPQQNTDCGDCTVCSPMAHAISLTCAKCLWRYLAALFPPVSSLLVVGKHAGCSGM